jgi:hypothetical protein
MGCFNLHDKTGGQGCSQSEVIKTQQDKIENLTERIIRLETILELIMRERIQET